MKKVVLVILAVGASLFLLLAIRLILAIFLMLLIWGGIASLFRNGPAEGEPPKEDGDGEADREQPGEDLPVDKLDEDELLDVMYLSEIIKDD
jgi:hypothetical protein